MVNLEMLIKGTPDWHNVINNNFNKVNNGLGLHVEDFKWTDFNEAKETGIYYIPAVQDIANAPVGATGNRIAFIYTINKTAEETFTMQKLLQPDVDKEGYEERSESFMPDWWRAWKVYYSGSVNLRGNSIEIGEYAESPHSNSVAIGDSAKATGSKGTAIGSGTEVSAQGTALGNGAKTTELNAIALGVGAKAEKSNAIAIGFIASAEGQGSIAITGHALNDSECLLGSSSSKWNVPGSFTVAGTKNFEIPHPNPQKQGSHRIRHSSVESPTAGDTLYRYTVKATKDNDLVSIALPDYFVHLNKDVQIFVTPQGHFGNGYGELNIFEEQLEIHCASKGEYNVLVIGTRNDDHQSIKDWNIKGVEREIGESWTGETYTFSVDEIIEIEEIREVI